MMNGAVAMLGLMALILAGCGGSDETSGVPPEASTESAPETEGQATEAPGEDDEQPAEAPSVSGTTTVPDGFPSEMPLPQGAAYSFNAGHAEYFWVERPVADVIEELETLLPAHGWTVVGIQREVAWRDDQLFEVDGHGLQMFVYAEPSAGSETETSISIGPR